MLTASATDGIWAAIKRLDRALAEQGRRSSQTPAVASALRSPSGITASAMAATYAPLVWRPDGTAEDWSTVFEAVTTAGGPRLSVYWRLRVDMGELGSITARLLVGPDEVFAGPLSEVVAEQDSYAAVGPFDIAEPTTPLRLVRIQLRAADEVSVTCWPPWLVWHDDTDAPELGR